MTTGISSTFSFRPDFILDDLPDGFLAFDDEWRYVYLNKQAEQLLGRSSEELVGKIYWAEYPQIVGTPLHTHCLQARKTGQPVVFEQFFPETESWIEFTLRPYARGLGAFTKNITDRRLAARERQRAEEHAKQLVADLAEERETLDTVNRIGRLLSAELDLDRLVQAATDAATELTGAQFGAFFFNKTDPKGESLLLYTISGVPREMFSHFPIPRATQLFGPTFRGEGIIRIGDVMKDARYGQTGPYHGMPPGHLPVRSYLSLPVLSRSGEVLGGLFFGHAEPDIFTEHVERNLLALVAQLTVAMDNARLFGKTLHATQEANRARDQAVREVQERIKAEEALARKAALATLRADITNALAHKGTLHEVLQQCTDALARHLDASFAGIWTRDEQQNGSVLQASTNTASEEDPVPFETDQIDRIVHSKVPAFGDQGGAGELEPRQDLFAGYPLLVEGRVVGVVALSGRLPLLADTREELLSVANNIAQGVERKRIEQRLVESEIRERAFLKDVLVSVTEGKLHLCDSASDLPERFSPLGAPILLTEQTLRVLRHQAREAGKALGFREERINDLITAASEAGMNAVVHAGGGIGTIEMDADEGTIQVRIEDQGSGIDVGNIPRATLDRGYTTAGTLGHGFKMVLYTIDTAWLLTGRTGTTIVLRQGREPRQQDWLH